MEQPGVLTKDPFNFDNLFNSLEFEIFLTTKKERLYEIIPASIVDICKRYNLILAGGTLTSVFSNQSINDFDLFFTDRENFDKQTFVFAEIARYYNIRHISKNARTYVKDNKAVQLITRSFNTPKNTLLNFDFTVCMCAFDFNTEQFTYHPEFFTDLISRELNYNVQYKYPLSVFKRINKYQQKGYKINDKNLVKLALSISNKTINSCIELEEQLGGFYFGKKADSLNKLISDPTIKQLIAQKTPIDDTFTSQLNEIEKEHEKYAIELNNATLSF